MGIEQLTGRLVAKLREAQNRKDAATERARAASWLTIQGVARRALAGVPDSTDDKDLMKAVNQLGLTADEASDALARLSEIIDAELDLLVDTDQPSLRRSEKPPGHVRQRLGDLVRLNPHLYSGKLHDPQLHVDRGLGESIVSRIRRAVEVAAAQRVVDGTGSGPYAPEDTMRATSALASYTRQAATIGNAEGDVPAMLLSGCYLPDLDGIVNRVLFTEELRTASEGDEQLSASWHCNTRPTLAKTRLDELQRERPELFKAPELQPTAVA